MRKISHVEKCQKQLTYIFFFIIIKYAMFVNKSLIVNQLSTKKRFYWWSGT